MKIKLQCLVSKDIKTYLESEMKTIEDLSSETKLSKVTIYNILKTDSASPRVLEAIYSFLYRSGYRLNSVKEELLKETNSKKILFHGSKKGLDELTPEGSRKSCDFGSGFYLGESYAEAASFVCESEAASVYSFSFDDKDLKILKFDTSLDWMLSICHFRGSVKAFDGSERIKSLVQEINESDLIIAPIANNRMFYIMSLFADGEVSSEVAIHSLSASKLGLQYIFKTEKAIRCLKPIEKYYLCQEEKQDFRLSLNKRAAEMDTKLKLAKREFREGKFVEEILK